MTDRFNTIIQAIDELHLGIRTHFIEKPNVLKARAVIDGLRVLYEEYLEQEKNSPHSDTVVALWTIPTLLTGMMQIHANMMYVLNSPIDTAIVVARLEDTANTLRHLYRRTEARLY